MRQLAIAPVAQENSMVEAVLGQTEEPPVSVLVAFAGGCDPYASSALGSKDLALDWL